MKNIGFIGAYDKTDLLLNIAKILTTMNFKVLVVDSTINQKARYVVPAIDPTVSYITSFEDIDVAIGFNNLIEIQRYAGSTGELPYDIALIDCDTIERIEAFELENASKNYFVTSFDNYSLKKGLEIFNELTQPVSLTKVLFSKDMLKEEDDYLNFLSLGRKIVWSEYRIYLPIENGDLSVIYENQRLAKIRFKKLSIQYKDGLEYLAEEIMGDVNGTKVRRAIKFIEKGV